MRISDWSSDVCSSDLLLQQPKLIVRVKDREIALQSRQFGMATKHFRPDGMKCAKPGHALHRLADNTPDAFPHFPCGLVGEGNGPYFGGPRLAGDRQCVVSGKRVSGRVDLGGRRLI